MERWVIAMKKADFYAIGEKYHISPILARLIRNRDIVGDENIDFYLNGTIADLYDGMLMQDMDRAVEILSEKIREEKRIRVIGDYDIDGINATYILQEGLSGLGAEADTDIPDRIRDGYGLNRMLIDRAIDDGIDTIVTCDNGIAATEEIAYGKEKGLTVIVTDHHEVPYVEMNGEKEYILPRADAVVDPHRADCEYPFKGLCGAAVAYKLIEALYNVMLRDPEDVDYLMENVAIATVGDVMDLTGENRIFVKQGLEMLKRTQNPGLKALIECTGIDVERLNAYHIGFVIGPCINASGRLDTAKRALELLNTKTRREAVMLAEDLKALNDSRKEMTERFVQEAAERIESTSLKEDRVLVVFLPDCHESIAGIIAGRIRERYYRPTFVLTRGEEGVKGSARSIEGYHIYEEMTRCSRFFTKYGGHKMAAGLSMREEDVEPFRREINRLCALTQDDLEEKIHIDVPMPVSHVSFSLVEELDLLEPFGTGNSKPVFAQKDLLFLSARALGKNGNALRFTVMDDCNRRWEMMYFGNREAFDSYVREQYGPQALDDLYEQRGSGIRMSAVYYPGINTWQGNSRLQLVMQHYMKI